MVIVKVAAAVVVITLSIKVAATSQIVPPKNFFFQKLTNPFKWSVPPSLTILLSDLSMWSDLSKRLIMINNYL